MQGKWDNTSEVSGFTFDVFFCTDLASRRNVSQDGVGSEESEQEPAPEASSSDREEDQLSADDEVPAQKYIISSFRVF